MNVRRKNLIRPALQLKITMVFMATSSALLAMMGYLVVWFLTDDTRGMPGDSDRLMGEVMPMLIDSFLITMALLVPVTLVVGILTTFLVAGPLYRFEKFIQSVIAGEKPKDCRLRKGDELQDICELLNEVTRPLREGSLDEGEGRDDSPKEEREELSTAA